MLSKWDATWHARMFPGGRAHPGGVKAAGGKCQTIVPVLFQSCQTTSLLPCIAARNRHVKSRPRMAGGGIRIGRRLRSAVLARKNRQGYSDENETESE